MLTAKRQAGLSARTSQCIHAVLRRALELAVRWERLDRNVAALVERPRIAKSEPDPFRADELTLLLQAASQETLSALFVLAATTGLRLGELLGLRWDDLDLTSDGTLRVRRTLRRTGTLAEPKSRAGVRDIALPRQAIAALQAHRLQQEARMTELDELWRASGLAFTTVPTRLEDDEDNGDLGVIPRERAVR